MKLRICGFHTFQIQKHPDHIKVWICGFNPLSAPQPQIWGSSEKHERKENVCGKVTEAGGGAATEKVTFEPWKDL